MKLRDYQIELLNKIKDSNNKRNCVQLSTGGGKTIIFSHLANNYNGRVLILVNRIELLEQTERNINRECSLITAGTNLIEFTPVTIGMVESVNNRLKKGLFDVNGFDLIIVDEIQNLQFTKVLENFEGRVLGFTATPVIDKRDFYFKCRYCETKHPIKTNCCGVEAKEFSKKLTLKKWYGDLITGTPISELIEGDFLTEVHNFVCDSPQLDKLKTDKSGQFTAKSEEEAFDNFSSLDNLILNYETHCKGIKTMVFNSGIKSNRNAYEKFVELGYSVRSYDSKSDEDRSEIVEWFRNTPDAVLMSVGVFTTGFDVDDVQAIIMNKATHSLSLYHQIVGRGGRITQKIFKPFFKLIDLGGNVNRFGSWSKNVDWETLYNSDDEKQRRVSDLEDFKTCKECEAMISHYPCEYCGAAQPEAKQSEGTTESVIAKALHRLPPPKPSHILNYAKAKGLDINGAKKLTANYIVDMFIYSQTSKATAIKKSADLEMKMRKFITPIYFALHGSDLEGNRKRTIEDFVKKVKEKINKYYE
mgnify:CR=1 FL=1